MPDTPIIDAETVLATAIRAALAPLVGTFDGKPTAYYWEAQQGCPLPYVVFHPQTPYNRLDFIGETDATVLITLKALATSPKAARDLLLVVAPGLDAITSSGYTIAARYAYSPAVAPVDNVSQALAVYRIRMDRSGVSVPTGWSLDFSQATNSGYLGVI